MLDHMSEPEEKQSTVKTDEPWTYDGLLKNARIVSENVPDDEDEICIAILEDCLDVLNREKPISGPMYYSYYNQDYRLKDTGYGIGKLWERSRFR